LFADMIFLVFSLENIVLLNGMFSTYFFIILQNKDYCSGFLLYLSRI